MWHICQEVCPFNQRRAVPTEEPAFQPREVTSSSSLVDLLLMDEETFRQKFKGSPIKRAKRRGLLRSAVASLCLRDDADAIAALKHAQNDPEELVREAGTWSLEQIRVRKAKQAENDNNASS